MNQEDRAKFRRMEADLRLAKEALAPFVLAHTTYKYVTAPMLKRAADVWDKIVGDKDGPK